MKGAVIFSNLVEISSYLCEYFGLRVLIMLSISVAVIGLLCSVVYLNFLTSFAYCENVSIYVLYGVFLFCIQAFLSLVLIFSAFEIK